VLAFNIFEDVCFQIQLSFYTLITLLL